MANHANVSLGEISTLNAYEMSKQICMILLARYVKPRDESCPSDFLVWFKVPRAAETCPASSVLAQL
jgi:hypothetical protein